ncbi:hypothetical protein ACHAWF_009082, partial [Thalassiosira exigua]
RRQRNHGRALVAPSSPGGVRRPRRQGRGSPARPLGAERRPVEAARIGLDRGRVGQRFPAEAGVAQAGGRPPFSGAMRPLDAYAADRRRRRGRSPLPRPRADRARRLPVDVAPIDGEPSLALLPDEEQASEARGPIASEEAAATRGPSEFDACAELRGGGLRRRRPRRRGRRRIRRENSERRGRKRRKVALLPGLPRRGERRPLGVGGRGRRRDGRGPRFVDVAVVSRGRRRGVVHGARPRVSGLAPPLPLPFEGRHATRLPSVAVGVEARRAAADRGVRSRIARPPPRLRDGAVLLSVVDHHVVLSRRERHGAGEAPVRLLPGQPSAHELLPSSGHDDPPVEPHRGIECRLRLCVRAPRPRGPASELERRRVEVPAGRPGEQQRLRHRGGRRCGELRLEPARSEPGRGGGRERRVVPERPVEAEGEGSLSGADRSFDLLDVSGIFSLSRSLSPWIAGPSSWELKMQPLCLRHKIPPRNLINLAQRYHNEIALQPLMAQSSSIALLQPPPSWGIASCADSDWVVRQKRLEERGLAKGLNRHQRKNRLKQQNGGSECGGTHSSPGKPSITVLIASGTGPDGLAEERKARRKRRMIARSVAVVVISVLVVLVKDYFSRQPIHSLESKQQRMGNQSTDVKEAQLPSSDHSRISVANEACDNDQSLATNTEVKMDFADPGTEEEKEPLNNERMVKEDRREEGPVKNDIIQETKSVKAQVVETNEWIVTEAKREKEPVKDDLVEETRREHKPVKDQAVEATRSPAPSVASKGKIADACAGDEVSCFFLHQA